MIAEKLSAWPGSSIPGWNIFTTAGADDELANPVFGVGASKRIGLLAVALLWIIAAWHLRSISASLAGVNAIDTGANPGSGDGSSLDIGVYMPKIGILLYDLPDWASPRCVVTQIDCGLEIYNDFTSATMSVILII